MESVMEMNESVEFIRCERIADIYSESSCDHSMPDYKGDVRKLLHTSAEVIPSGKFADNGELCISGIVCYKVVYLNSENGIEGEEFTSDYDLSVKCPTENVKDFFEKTRIAASNVRLTGPRRFSAKCSLVTDIYVSRVEELITENGADDRELELKELTALAIDRKSFCSGEREYAEKLITLEGAIADDVRVITQSADVTVTSLARSGDEVTVKGNIRIDYLLSRADLPPYPEQSVIPFEQTVTVEDVGDAATLFAKGRVSSLKLNVNPEDFGTSIVADVIAEICVETVENRELGVYKDGYAIGSECEPSYERLSYSEHVSSASHKSGVEVTVKREELGLGVLRDIIYTNAFARIEEAKMLEDGACIKGEVRFSGIASEVEDGDSVFYSGFKYCAPFAVNVNMNLQNRHNLTLEAEALTCGASALIDKDSVVLSAELGIRCTVTEAKETERLCGITVISDNQIEKRPSVITVYYPERGEELFEIAKHFKVSVRDVAVWNSLTESVMNDLNSGAAVPKRLIIK